MKILGWSMIVLFAGMASGQPATLTLRAKLRDFKDYLPTDTATHPDFENDAFLGCGGENLGYVRNTISLAGSVDTTLFRGDDRDPVLQVLNNPTTGSPCFTGVDRFHQWYNDVPSVNRSFYADLTLTRNAQGVYSFTDDNFLPLNQGAAWRKFHPTDPDPFGPRPEINATDVWGFTLELHTVFTYTAGQGQTFSFKGDDDVWVFINGRLAIDLGGLHPSMPGAVNLDDKAAILGLVDGGNYPLDFFFAERHSTGSHCQITTSLQLLQKTALPTPVATPSGQIFRDSIRVSLSVPGHADAQIHYTLDGSEPTAASPLYAAPLGLMATTTLKAKGFHADFLESSVLTEVYTRERLALPAPVADPRGSNFVDTLRVSLTVPGHADAQIHYTLNGSEPTAASPLYTGVLTLTGSTVLKAMAVRVDWLPSGVMTETYTKIIPPNVISLKVVRPIGESSNLVPVPSLPGPTRPIAVVAEDRVGGFCLACPPGTEAFAQGSKLLPEWVTSTRDPFHYDFQIFDNLGLFLLSQSGEVTREMLDRLPVDAAGYRIVRFKWIPVAANGQLVGTGAYILKGSVHSPGAVLTGPSGAMSTESTLFTTLGYLRKK